MRCLFYFVFKDTANTEIYTYWHTLSRHVALPIWPGVCGGEFACVGAKVSAGLAPMTPEQARGAGARSMVIGVANPGGLIPDGWLPGLLQALEAGLDLKIGRAHV